jgi:hypothetical protein
MLLVEHGGHGVGGSRDLSFDQFVNTSCPGMDRLGGAPLEQELLTLLLAQE